MRRVCNSMLVVVALLGCVSTLAAQQGTITDVTVSDTKAYAGSSITATVTGTSGVCGAVEINWGDGDTATYRASALPLKKTHVYKTAGSFAVLVRGVRNCAGQAGVRLEILPTPGQTPAPERTTPTRPRGTITGIEMPPSARLGDDVAITITGTGTCRIVVDFDNGEERSITQRLPYRLTYKFSEVGPYEIVVWTDDGCSGFAEKVLRIRAR